jgi:hypothetical protein
MVVRYHKGCAEEGVVGPFAVWSLVSSAALLRNVKL